MVNPVSTSNSNGSNLNSINALMREVNNDRNVRVIKDEHGTRVVMLDKNGLRTTAVGGGIDVFTATDDQLTFNSARNTLKIVTTGTLTLPGFVLGINDGKAGTREVLHGLSDIPVVMAYGRVNNTITPAGDYTTATSTVVNAYAPLPYDPINSLFDTNVSAYQITVVVDETKVYFSYLYETNGLGGYTFPDVPIKYYILEQTVG